MLVQGLPLAKVNPRLARRFAEATGRLAKTDRIDAELLARYGTLLQPRPQPLLKRHNIARLVQIRTQLAQIDQAIMALIAEDVSLKARFDILVSIPGLSKITAFALLIEIPELGGLHEKAAAALCGLAPMNRQSGRWTGRAFIIGGRAIVRQALYMPALVAARFIPDLKAKYEALIKAGKAPKVAITALMRKMIGLANALLRQKRKWAPKLA